jgi:hypothetical protein
VCPCVQVSVPSGAERWLCWGWQDMCPSVCSNLQGDLACSELLFLACDDCGRRVALQRLECALVNACTPAGVSVVRRAVQLLWGQSLSGASHSVGQSLSGAVTQWGQSLSGASHSQAVHGVQCQTRRSTHIATGRLNKRQTARAGRWWQLSNSDALCSCHTLL